MTLGMRKKNIIIPWVVEYILLVKNRKIVFSGKDLY